VEKTKDELIEILLNDSTNSFCDKELKYISKKNFHFFDIDNDGDTDILFQGRECEGFASETVIAYINNNETFTKSIYNRGRIAEIKLKKELIIYEYPCCAMIENNLLSYSVSKDKIELEGGITFFHSFLFTIKNNPLPSESYKDMLPKYLKSDTKLTLNENTVIKYCPIDSIIQPTYIKNNSIGTLSKQVQVDSYSTYKDKNGKKWFYCIIPNTIIITSKHKLKLPTLAWVRQE